MSVQKKSATFMHISRLSVLCALILSLVLQVVTMQGVAPASAAGAPATSTLHGPAKPIKSKMTTKFASMALSGTNCASSSTSPLIYNCYVRGVSPSSATIMWESDVKATATVCFGQSAYTNAQCSNSQATNLCSTGTNQGSTITSDQITSQQLPSGNWLYSATAALTSTGTYHYLITLQTASGSSTTSNDLTFTSGDQKPDFQDNFYGASMASSPYFTENWLGGTPAGSGPVVFQDLFNSGKTLSSSWFAVSGTWAVNSKQGVATTSTAGSTYENVQTYGQTPGMGELTSSITLPPVSSSYPYDDAGFVIVDGYFSLWYALDTNATCDNQPSQCGSGEYSTGMWVNYKSPYTGLYETQGAGSFSSPPSAFAVAQPGQTYYFDFRLNGSDVFVFERLSTTDPWTLVSRSDTSPYGSMAYAKPGLWNGAPTAKSTPVQYQAFTIYNTVTEPSGVTQISAIDPSYTPYYDPGDIYSPNSTSDQSQFVGSGAGAGLQVNTQDGEVEFSTDNLGGILVRVTPNAQTHNANGDLFSVTLGSGTITGGIQSNIEPNSYNEQGSFGPVSGTAPWQVKARFDGTNLALYAESSGSTTWHLLAAGQDTTFTSGTYIWPQPNANSELGSFTITSLTSPVLANWQGGVVNYTQIATTSVDAATPGQMAIQLGGPQDSVNSTSTQDINSSNITLADGTLATTFEYDTTQISYNFGPYIKFRMRDPNDYYSLQLSPTQQMGIGVYDNGMSLNRVTNGHGVVLGTLPIGCYPAPGQTYQIQITMLGGLICAAVEAIGTSSLSELCAFDSGGWDQAGGVGFGITVFGSDSTNEYLGPVSVTPLRSGSNYFDPSALTTGAYSDSGTDLTLPGRGPQITWDRQYSSAAAASGKLGPLGHGWTDRYLRTLTVNADGSVSISSSTGTVSTFALDSADGAFAAPAGDFDQLQKNADGSYTLTDPSHNTSTWRVVNAGGPDVLTQIADADGNTTSLSYSASNTLQSISDPSGRVVTLTYNGAPIGSLAAGTLITQVSDGSRQVSYGYDSAGNLHTVTDVDGYVTTYVYDSSLNPHLLTKRYDANNNPATVSSPKYLLNTYAADSMAINADAGYHLVQQVDPNGVMTQMSYNSAALGDETVTLDPGSAPHLNETTTTHANAQYSLSDETNPLGITTATTHDADNLPLNIVADTGSGHLNLTNTKIYGPRGNLLEQTDASGVATVYYYDDTPTDAAYNKVTEMVVDPVPPSGGSHLNATYTFAYYPQLSPPAGFTGNPGDLFSTTDPLGHVTRYSYNSAGQVTTVEDANGHYTTYSYDAHGMPSQTIVDPTSLDPGGLNLTTTYDYDSVGHLLSKVDPTGVTTSWTYDNLGRVLQRVVDPYDPTTNPQGLNLTTTNAYDAVGNLLSTTLDPTPSGGSTCSVAYGASYTPGCHMNETTSYVYDADNRRTKITNPLDGQQVTYPGASSATTLSGVTTYVFDAAGNVTQITDPNGAVTKQSYDANNELTQALSPIDGSQVTYPGGASHTFSGKTTYTYDAVGRLTQETDPGGVVIAYAYDGAKRPTSLTIDPTGLDLVWKKSYDSAGRLSTLTDPRNDVESFAYDADSHQILTQSPLGAQTSATYDAVGNQTSEIADPLPQGQTSGHLNLVTQFAYDPANRVLTQTVDPTSLGGSGRLNEVTQYYYDGDGRTTEVTDANGHSTVYQYDHAGRLIDTKDAHAFAVGGAAWQFTYDGAGNERSTIDPLGYVTAMQYDLGNDPIQQVIDPNPSGQSGHLALTQSTYYDSDGNAVDTTNANGQTTQFTYDTLDRLTKTTYSSATTPDVALYYDDAGNRAYMTDGTGPSGAAWAYSYDLSGRLLSAQDPTGVKVSYGYDASGDKGLLTSLTYPSGHGLTFAYNQDNQLTTIASPSNALFGTGTAPATTSFQYTYDLAGRVTALSYPNGVGLSYSYDAASHLTSINATSGANTLASWAYTVDGVGNPTKVTDSTVGGTGATNYSYDEANRLTNATYWDGSTQAYTYDAAGNRSSMVAGATTTPYAYDAAGRLLSAGATTYTYDNDGNRTSATTSGATTTYSYDQADRLIGATGDASPSAYTYNGDGQRLSMTTGGATTTYQWDPLNQTLLSDGANEYVEQGSGGLLTQTPIAGGGATAAYAVADALGSTRLLTNGSAQTQGSFAYDAFGQSKATSGTSASILGFTGQLTDSSTGFQDLRARLYDPQTGQFLSRDTYPGAQSDPLSLNPYMYVSGDPTRLTDPSGHCPWCVTALIGAAVGAAVSYGTQVYNNYQNGKTGSDAWTQVDVGEIAKSAVIGLVAGATLGLAAPVTASAGEFVGAALEMSGASTGFASAAATVTTGAVAGGLSGAAGQIAQNITHGQPWNQNLDQATAQGLAAGGVLGLAGVGVGAASDALSGADTTATDGTLAATSSASNDTTLTSPTTDATDVSESGANCGGVGGLSFSADTLVQTPSGEQPIASLQVGDHVTSYDPTTGKATTQTITHVYLNHDSDRLDVTLALPATSGTTHTATATQDAAAAREQRALVMSHARRGPPDTSADVSKAASNSATAATSETIHTTANHPWLTADRGWVDAGQLYTGEPVRLMDGGTATVAALHAVPGAGPMWDLSLDAVHTFAVGADQAVVHNTDPCDPLALNTTERPVYVHRVSHFGNRELGMSQDEVLQDIRNNQRLLGASAQHGEGVWAYRLGPNPSGSLAWPHNPVAANEIVFTTDTPFIEKGGINSQIDQSRGGDNVWGGPGWQAKEGHFAVEAGEYMHIQIIAQPGDTWAN